MKSDDEHTDPLDSGKPVYGLSYPAPFDKLVLALCCSATRTLKVLSPQLDHAVFDCAELVDAVSALARRDSQSQVRILISDSRPIVHHGHRLLSLAQRVPSSIVIRKLADHPEMTGETFVLRDTGGVIYSPADGSPGFYDPDSRASAKKFIDKFDLLWQRGVQDPQLRRLGL